MKTAGLLIIAAIVVIVLAMNAVVVFSAASYTPPEPVIYEGSIQSFYAEHAALLNAAAEMLWAHPEFFDQHRLSGEFDSQFHIRDILQDRRGIKHCEVYRACRDVVRGEKDAPDKALYRKQHQAEYQLHDVTLKELAELGIHKLPSTEKLQRQQLDLEEELASAKKEKQDLQKQQKTLQVIEHNFDAMIREAGVKVPEKTPSQKTPEDVLS